MAYRITKDAPDGYHVAQGEIATSTGSLKTSGLYTCVGFALAQGDKLLFTHADADAGQLSWIIGETFDKKKEIRVQILNSSEDCPITTHARNKCLKALSFAGVSSTVEYGMVNGGLMAEVTVQPTGEYSSAISNRSNTASSSMIDFLKDFQR